MEDESENIRNLKSIEAAEKSFVTFFNKTQRRADVIWINYQGNPVLYQTLRPGECFEANTFVTHPWIFKDADTGDKLVVESREYYLPTPWNTHDVRFVRRGEQVFAVPHRTPVHITLPVYSLLQRSMQVIRNCLSDNVVRDCLQDSNASQCQVNNLELPGTLQAEFLHFVRQSFQHRQF